jgi:hypothetical protein
MPIPYPLTDLGEGALQTMMNLGMMIDIDHMSRLAADEALEIAKARNYPINSGHNGLLADDCISGRGGDLRHCNENNRTRAQYENIRQLSGLIGLGHGGRATNFVKNYRTVLEIMGNRPVAIGTDANGLEALPAPDPQAPIRYDAHFPRYRFANRTWDINSRIVGGKEIGDGFAHYGLFPDYIRSWQTNRDPEANMTERNMDAFMSSAEGFARMWEKSVLRSAGTPRTRRLRVSTRWCIQADAVVHTGDFNGDGANDLLCRDTRHISIDYADRFGALSGTADWSLETRWCTHNGIMHFELGDFNGDGRTDMMCKDRGRIWVNTANAEGRFSVAAEGRGSFVQDTTWCTGLHTTLQLTDVNGDGRTDLLCRDSGLLEVAYANPSGNFSIP